MSLSHLCAMAMMTVETGRMKVSVTVGIDWHMLCRRNSHYISFGNIYIKCSFPKMVVSAPKFFLCFYVYSIRVECLQPAK